MSRQWVRPVGTPEHFAPARGLAAALALCGVALSTCRSPDDVFHRAAEDVTVSTASLTATVKLPARFNQAKTYTLVVALHGSGMTAADFAAVFASYAGDSLVVAVPEGEFHLPEGGHSWFYVTDDPSVAASHDSATVRHLVQLIGAIRERYRFNRVVAFGFSQGATLAYMTGLLHPSLVTGVVAVGGFLPPIDRAGAIVHAPDVTGARSVRLFVARGTGDAAITHEEFLAQRSFFVSRGYHVTALEYYGPHLVTPGVLDQVSLWLKARPW